MSVIAPSEAPRKKHMNHFLPFFGVFRSFYFLGAAILSAPEVADFPSKALKENQ